MSGIRLGPAGSQSARDRGCRCEERDGVVRTHPYCPFHGAVTPLSDSRTHDGECDRAQPVRLSGGAQ